MSTIELTALSYLAPNFFKLYRKLMDILANQLDLRITTGIGAEDYHDYTQADLLFICGLPYVFRADSGEYEARIEALVAPVLSGKRYQAYDRPVYFSDIIVHAESDIHSFEELAGRSWAYNEPESQSGYGVMCYQLASTGKKLDFFSDVVKAGYHRRSIRMVANGKIDSATIDSQLLEAYFKQYPRLKSKLRIIETIGPSTIQPLAVRSTLPASLKADIRAVLLDIHKHPDIQAHLKYAMIDRFVAVRDSDYDDIRKMYQSARTFYPEQQFHS